MFQSRENFLDALRVSPEGRKLSEGAARETVAQRQKLEGELAAVNETAAREWPRAFARCEEATKAVRAAEKALRDANGKLAAANYERFRISEEYTRLRANLEAALAESASPLLAAFEDEMHHEMNTVRKQIETRDISERNEVTGKVSFGVASNAASIKARCQGCTLAIESARDLRLKADQSGVPAALDALRDGLPKVESV